MIISLSGYARSGKDSVGRHLASKHGFERLAFADALKEVAYTLNPIISFASYEDPVRLQTLVDNQGWEAIKKLPEVRRILQVLGTECGRDILGENIWVDIVACKIEPEKNYVITDCRFPNELAFVEDSGGITWWIERLGNKPVNSHISERAVTMEDTLYQIWNRGTLNDLYLIVDNLLREINDKNR